MVQGTVFSIEEFALHDGPGVRTTVFLKGCPLSCVWCHSPEGQSFSPQAVRSPNGCLMCGACTQKGLGTVEKPIVVPGSAAVCPQNLIRMSGIAYTPEELTEKILKNAAFMQASGGGVTFSGGEPLAQAAFLSACLHILDGKLHRALQMSGFAPAEVFRTVLADCDYVLYDLKIMDPARHKAYCGQDNAQILANYRTLAASGKDFITRVPLIPTLTDTAENIWQIACFIHACGVKYVELLPYQPLSGSKYAMTGRVYAPPFDESLAPQPHTEIFESFGIEVHTL